MEQNQDLTLAGLIHDLNNVFQTLVEAADLLGDDPQWNNLSAVIERSVERGKELTLALQKTEQPPASLHHILDYARSFVEDFLVAARGPEIRFFCQIDESLELRQGLSWERVFINLFSNSLRAMPDGGAIFVNAHRAGTNIEIVVADDGPGIRPEILQNIFEPNVSSRREGGLGLHIVQSIVHDHKGCVRAANGERGGAEFSITIPAEPAFLRQAGV